MQTRRTFLSSLASTSMCSIASAAIPKLSALADAAVLAAIDALTQRFVKDAGISAAQLAVVRSGPVIFSKVYAEAPPKGYAAVTSQSLFRIASCSKMFTCAAITALTRSGKLDLQAKVFPLLGIRKPALAGDRPDPHIEDITVQHLVDHAGGWNDHKPVQLPGRPLIPSSGFDPVFRLRQIALDMGLSGPPSKMEVARYMFGKPLQFVPGTANFSITSSASYSNFGYMLLGLVVEKVSGHRYIDFVRDGVDGPGAWPDVHLSPMLSRQKNPAEVWYVDHGVGPTVFDPRSNAQLPYPYGGGGFLTETMDSGGGIMTTAETLARFSARHAVWGLGGRAPGSERNGSMAGTSSDTFSRPNGVDCAFVLNTNKFNGGQAALDTFVVRLRRLLDQL